MIRLSIAIQGYYVRLPKIRKLEAQLQHPDVAVTSYVDDGSLGCWGNNLRCWMGHSDEATHHMNVQDDAKLCPGFVEAALAAIKAKPNVPISFYCRHARAVADAKSAGVSWVKLSPRSSLPWQYSFVFPANMAKHWLAWAQTPSVLDNDEKYGKYDDTRVQGYLCDHRINFWATVPSLVDHGAPGDSVIGNSNITRVATWFASDGAASVDWTLTP